MWLNRKCDERERLSNRDKNVMFIKIKELPGGPRNRYSIAINKIDEEIAMDKQEVKQRWQDYTLRKINTNTS